MQILKKSYQLIFILLIAVFSLPILISICYIVPGADDYCNAISMEKLRESYSVLTAAVIFSKNVFLGWQGTYFSSFLVGLHPNIEHSYLVLRATLIFFFLLYVCGLFLSVLIFTKNILKFSLKISYLISTIVTILSLNTTTGGEWFTWYTGCAVYQIPMICYFYSLIFLVKFSINRKISLFIISSVLAFVASGGSLAITSFGCSILLFILFFVTDKNDLFSKQNLLLACPFLISVLGGLVNSLAPGNFVRYSLIERSGELHVFNALKYSLFALQDHLTYLSSFSIFLFLGWLFLATFKNESLTITFKQFVFFVTFGVVSIVLVAFPILLGYSSQSIDHFSRMSYSYDLTIIFYSVVLTIALVCFLRNSKFINKLFSDLLNLNKLIVLVFVLLCLVYFIPGVKQGYSYKTFKDLKHGYIQEATSSLAYVYNELSKSKNLDVVISIKPFKTSTIYLPGISSDPNHWINSCTSMYLGAKSCSVKLNN